MSIRFENNKTFTIDTENSTYQMMIDPYGYLLHLYYGRKTKGFMDYLLIYADRGFSGNPYNAGKDRTYSMDNLPQEFPYKGTGDYRVLACVLQKEDGMEYSDFKYQSHKIYDGKYSLEGLPAVYAGEEEAQTLEITLKDNLSGVEVILLYGVLPRYDVITRSVKIKNAGKEKIIIQKILSACLDFVSGEYDFVTFYGRHAMERLMQRSPVVHGSQRIGSRRGTSSHQYNPMVILADSKAEEDVGDCYSMSFVYSGNFEAEVEKDQFGQTRLLMGLQNEGFAYPLEAGEEFIAPEVVMTFSSQGFGQLSWNLHSCIREHIYRGKYKKQTRPILVNSWEGAYFDFNGETIYQLALEAKELGIDMVVMDDGWFGKRDDDFRGLGDWYVNEDKLGESLGHLINRINELGIKFGIWFEPECVNEDSEFYLKHPEWVLAVPGKGPVRSRYQLVLDFSRKEVVDTVFDMVCSVVDQGNIEYIKWDMNRSLDDVFSREATNQGKVSYDYVLGLYDFLERLCKRYPDLLLEGCSGGGGRFDLGMLYYSPQIWCSDNTDAIDRMKIQYGTSFGYPISSMGSHVSAVPNHQTGRTTSLEVRSTVAMAGTFGYELNLGKMTREEKEEVKKQIITYRKHASLIQSGRYYRLTNPFKEEAGAWAFVSEDQSEVLVNMVLQEMHGNMTNCYIRLKGLMPGRFYRDEESKDVYPSDALMQIGLPIPIELGDFRAYQRCFVLEE